jgi:hypothetical protein
MLDAALKQRYARHLLLAEIGEGGQARLLATRVRLESAADPRAREVASEYLRRAGVTVGDSGASVSLGDTRAITALAGSEHLHDAAAALAGAFGAVEAIKRALGVGRAGSLEGLCIDTGVQKRGTA